MDVFFTILFLSCVLVVQIGFLLGEVSDSGECPGLIRGKLAGCGDRPNCACSDIDVIDDHYIEPIRVPRHLNLDLPTIIKNVITDINGHIRKETDTYIAATFSSSFFRFVDDFEVRIDPEHSLVHIRSASRVGYSDSGANRKRAKRFREAFEKTLHLKHFARR